MSLFVSVCAAKFSVCVASGSDIQLAHRSEASSALTVRMRYLPQSIRTEVFGIFGALGAGMTPLGLRVDFDHSMSTAAKTDAHAAWLGVRRAGKVAGEQLKRDHGGGTAMIHSITRSQLSL